jgi:hypothetical protein
VNANNVRAVAWTALLALLYPFQLHVLGADVALRDALSALVLIPIAWRNAPLGR